MNSKKNSEAANIFKQVQMGVRRETAANGAPILTYTLNFPTGSVFHEAEIRGPAKNWRASGKVHERVDA
jgi:hypothetical protein